MSKQSYPVLTLTVLAAGGTIPANRMVTPTGTLAGANDNTLGVNRASTASGDAMSVDVLGTAVVEVGGTCTVGGTLESDSSGRVVDWSTSGAKIAIALQGATTAGDFIEVLLIPNAA